MKIERKSKESRLEFFRDLYQEAQVYSVGTTEKLKQHKAQYKGSLSIDNSSTDATQVRNITYELVESQVSGYIPVPSVSPITHSDAGERRAKSIETLLKNKRDELPFERMNDLDERFNPIYGASVWLIEWDNSIITHNTVGDVRISCISPLKFTGQPGIYDVQDMEYCFIKFDTTKDDISRKYGVSLEVAKETENETSADGKTATLYVCYYKNESDKVCQFVWSGDTVLLDLDDYYARKRTICSICGKKRGICVCEKPAFSLKNEDYEELTRDIRLSDGSIISAKSVEIKDGYPVTELRQSQAIGEDGDPLFEILPDGSASPVMVEVEVPKTIPTRLPFYVPNTLPVVIRKNTSEEDSLFGQSDCEFIRPQQQGINKLESRIQEKLMGAGVYPIVPDDINVELDNSIFKKVFRARQNNYGLFGRIDLQVDISRDVMQSERLYDQAKRIVGISDSFLGQSDSSAESGKAKQLLIQQSSGRLDSKRRMKNAAYADIDRIVFEYYLAYADEPRPATYRDASGNLQNVTFNRYDFINRDDAGEYYYDDRFVFSADASTDISTSRELLWSENRQNFQGGAYGDPSLIKTQLIFWQNMEKAHYPWARENVERLREEIRRSEVSVKTESV